MSAQPKQTLEKILASMGFEAVVEEQKLEDGVLLDVKTEESGRLIGRQGQTLADLQYITNRILFQQDSTLPKVMVDVSGYRAQTREALVKRAKDAADKVRRWGDPVELEPMNAFDRRVVHQALKDDPDVETHSIEVEGTDKKVLRLKARTNRLTGR
ncbi:MAG TPA: R3H domain-containing nucleic acid-binding protein [Verrucomicrobiae bacterium]|nr:R3H domain-containing nucleic acid-binding protein [Verrucomicrobiae bacterium]